jgi:hypothetical protein
LKRRDITPIVDLCHFGVPTGSATSRTPISRPLFARYAALRRALSVGPALHAGQRDVHLRRFSPNTAGGTSRLKTDRGFVTALKNIVKAMCLR